MKIDLKEKLPGADFKQKLLEKEPIRRLLGDDFKRKFLRYYPIVVVILASVSVVLALADLFQMPITRLPFFYPLDIAILILFAIDYVVRLSLAQDKRLFFKKNVFDLIAIIPFSSFFSLFRTMRILRMTRVMRVAQLTRMTQLAQLTRLTRLVSMVGRLKKRANHILHMNGLIYVIYLNLASILCGSFAIYLLERGTTVNTFADALWWAFVTSTTVGYGDISPSTAAGRIVAVILMLFGIGLVSMLTGTIATYFTLKNSHSQRQQRLDRLSQAADALSDEQLDRLIAQAQRDAAQAVLSDSASAAQEEPTDDAVS